ncbi:MAG: ABC transporter permease subunit [Eubacterium sp.]|nr:ABC transporter permease subunit [Eubacterium sp.]
MLELIKLEMKKLCRRKLTIIVTVCGFLATVLFFSLPFLQFLAWDQDGNMLSRSEAIEYRHKCYDSISGEITEERVTQDLKEYQEKRNNPDNIIIEKDGEVTFTDEVFFGYLSPRSSYMDMLGNTYIPNQLGHNNITKIDLTNGADFYNTRNEIVKNLITNNYDLTESEKEYWLDKNEKINEPYEYGYALGWSSFGDTAVMLIISILGICIALASVFANEYQAGTDAVILSTRYGKSKIIYAKIITSFVFATAVFTVNAITALAIPLITRGADGANLPLQIMDTTIPYPLTFLQATLITIGIAYAVMLGLVSITLLCSAKMKTAFPVLIIDVLFIFIPIFLKPGSNALWNRIAWLLPYNSMSGLSIFKEYLSYPTGITVFSVLSMIVILYFAITLTALPLAGRGFKKHQVK